MMLSLHVPEELRPYLDNLPRGAKSRMVRNILKTHLINEAKLLKETDPDVRQYVLCRNRKFSCENERFEMMEKVLLLNKEIEYFTAEMVQLRKKIREKGMSVGIIDNDAESPPESSAVIQSPSQRYAQDSSTER